MAKIEYIRCPRCELNYITSKDKLCSVCKKEVEAAFKKDDDDFDIGDEFDICPVCKTNYIREDEDMCANCARERDLDRALHGDSILYDDLSEQDDYENDRLKNDDEFGDMISISDEEELENSMNDLDLDIQMDDEMDMNDLSDLDEEEDEDEDEFNDEDDDDDLEDEEDDDFEDDFDDEEDEDDEIKPKSTRGRKKKN